jgi:hypothetical protein
VASWHKRGAGQVSFIPLFFFADVQQGNGAIAIVLNARLNVVDANLADFFFGLG